MAPRTPRAMVTHRPPPSRPGMMSLARAPAMRPTINDHRMFMNVSFFVQPGSVPASERGGTRFHDRAPRAEESQVKRPGGFARGCWRFCDRTTDTELRVAHCNIV